MDERLKKILTEKLLEHTAEEGHEVEIVTYGRPSREPMNVSLECTSPCGEVVLDFDLEE